MIPKLRILVPLVLAVAATSALLASAAQAEPQWMTTGNVNATIKGEQEGTHTFEVEGPSTQVTCKSATFESVSEAGDPGGSVLSFPRKTKTTKPIYKECTAFGFAGAEVKNEGCHIRLHLGKPTFVPTVHWKVRFTFTCTKKGDKVTISANGGTCKASVTGTEELEEMPHSDFGETGVWKNNGGTPETGTLEGNVEGITVNKEVDGFLCPLNGTGTVNTGVYKGSNLVKAFNEKGEQVGITAEGE